MRIIDRYVTSSIIKTFLSTMFIFSFIYILVDLTGNLSDILKRGVPADILIRYYLANVPISLVQTASIGCLIAILLTFSQLNNSNEIIVLRASGMNFWQISKPAICFGLIVSALLFWVNESYAPKAAATAKKLRDENIILEVDSKRKKTEKIRNLTFYGLKNRLFFIDSFDPRTYDLNGITIIGHDNKQNIKEKIIALNGKWTGIAWKFYQVQITTFDPADQENPEKIRVEQEKLMDIKESPEDFLKQRLKVNAMNSQDLYQYIKRFSQSGATKALKNLQVDFHEKVAFPFGNMAIILVGMPFGLMMRRRKAVSFTSLGIALLIGFFYYVLNAVGLALGKGGLLPPIYAAWLAPAVVFIAALYIIKTKF